MKHDIYINIPLQKFLSDLKEGIVGLDFNQLDPFYSVEIFQFLKLYLHFQVT